MNRILQAFAVLGLVVVAAFAGHLLFPTHEPAPPPLITTIVDTIHDTLKVPTPSRPAAGAPNLVIRETHHDLVTIAPPMPSLKPLVLVMPDTSRPRLYPLLSVLVGEHVGDSTYVTTFGLQRGDGVTSTFYTPGPLKSIVADSAGTPRADWYPPPDPGCELGCKVKLVTAGAGVGTLAYIILHSLFQR